MLHCHFKTFLPLLASDMAVRGIAFEPKRTAPTEPQKSFLRAYNEIPEWYQDNDVIRHGYRPASNSLFQSVLSIGYIHNESGSIYSHLFPAIFAVYCEYLLLQYFRDFYPDATDTELRIFSSYFIGAAICFTLSATYHTLLNHSEFVANMSLRCDYIGILTLTLGKFITGVYMCFYCEETWQKVYWTMIVTLGTATATILVSPVLQHRRYRTLRALAFVFTALSGFAPLFHGLWMFGVDSMMVQSGMPYYLLEGLLLAIGAAFYVMRVPESISPGKFDIWGCSHQIFHVLVVAAFVLHGVGIWTAFDYNYHHRKCATG